MTTPPHLAELVLTPVTPERTEEFLGAAMHGFYHEYEPESWAPGRAVFEAERNFGFTVDDRWVTTCCAYSRTLTVPGGSVPAAAVTFVTVHPSYRRRGLLRRMMEHQLTGIAERCTEPVALLWATEAEIYGRYGYGQATSLIHVSGATLGTAFRADVDLGSGSVAEVDAAEWLSVAEELHARLLPERVGALDRPRPWWEWMMNDHPSRRNGSSAYRYALHHPAAGEPDGFLAFRTRTGSSGIFEPGVEVRVTTLDAVEDSARAALWRFALDLDLVRSFSAVVAYDDPLRLQVADQASVKAEVADGTFIRLVDVARALEERRYAAEVDLVLEVRDALLPQNAGRFRLQGGPDGASVTRVQAGADVALDVRDLGAVYLGGVSPTVVRRAGLLEERTPGAATRMAAAFGWPSLPHCVDFF